MKGKYTLVFEDDKVCLAIKIGIFYEIDYSKYVKTWENKTDKVRYTLFERV